MKKIIILGALVVTGIASYVVGYSYFSFDRPSINLKEREYVMPDTTLEAAEDKVEDNKEPVYILYSMYGEVLIYGSDGSFYDYTGIYLQDLTREEQIEILKRDRVFTRDELYNYLESLTS